MIPKPQMIPYVDHKIMILHETKEWHGPGSSESVVYLDIILRVVVLQIKMFCRMPCYHLCLDIHVHVTTTYFITISPIQSKKLRTDL